MSCMRPVRGAVTARSSAASPDSAWSSVLPAACSPVVDRRDGATAHDDAPSHEDAVAVQRGRGVERRRDRRPPVDEQALARPRGQARCDRCGGARRPPSPAGRSPTPRRRRGGASAVRPTPRRASRAPLALARSRSPPAARVPRSHASVRSVSSSSRTYIRSTHACSTATCDPMLTASPLPADRRHSAAPAWPSRLDPPAPRAVAKPWPLVVVFMWRAGGLHGHVQVMPLASPGRTRQSS